MVMIRARIDLQLFNHLASQENFSAAYPLQHAPAQIRDGFHQGAVGSFFQTARIPCMAVIYFLIQFVAGKHQLVCVYDDNIIAHIRMRRKFRFMLASQNVSNTACQTAEGFRLPRPLHTICAPGHLPQAYRFS